MFWCYLFDFRLDNSESLFITPHRNMPLWRTRNSLYCVCGDSQGEAICSATQNLQCTSSKSITAGKCHGRQFRSKRSLKSHGNELERLFKKMQKPRKPRKSIAKVNETGVIPF